MSRLWKGKGITLGFPLCSKFILTYSRFISFITPETEKVVLLLDYDGTLAPLTEELSVMPKDTEINIKKLAANDKIFMVVFSGRELSEIKNHLKFPNVTYAGNHGLEVEYPSGKKFKIEMPEELLEKHNKLVAELKEKVRKMKILDDWESSSCDFSAGCLVRCLGGGQEDLCDLSLQGRHRQAEGQAHCRGQGSDSGPWLPADRDPLRLGGQATRQLGQRLVQLSTESFNIYTR